MKIIDKHTGLFDRIAKVYGWFFHRQQKGYEFALKKLSEAEELSSVTRVLDIGCGTGALCSVFAKSGYQTFGVDSSHKMLEQAKSKTKGLNIDFQWASIVNDLPFENDSMDLVSASFVAHGLPKELRMKMLNDMNRISNHFVILIEFNQNRRWYIDMVEWAEHGDYFNFIKTIDIELSTIFTSVKKVQINDTSSIYICKKDRH
ncbi:MAG: class I SAM-dependent methyltransferase [Erysipelotrichaceae bacterium]|nr:class I SAM-dependent methyltransferase [Erysipelotrichaceae bacterium]